MIQIYIQLKIIHNLKVELCIIWQDFLGLPAWEAASRVNPERTAPRKKVAGGGGDRIYKRFATQGR